MLNPDNLRRIMILGKKVQLEVQIILAAIRFRMLHVLIYQTDAVLVILCGCEIWCLTSREDEHRMRVCESSVVRRIFDVSGR
jgi:hypothetical protein